VIGYTKLFASILASSIWSEPAETRVVWVTLLALKNRDHIVEASLPGIAALARVTMAEAAAAIATLEAPDPHSRTKDHDGRRIQAVEGGWLILNGERYQQKFSREERREYLRRKQAERREKLKLSTPRQQMSTVSTHSASASASNFESESVAPPIEFPVGFPESAEVAASHAAFVGATEDFARQVWNESAARGGLDCFGRPVVSFRSYLAGRVASDKSRQAERKSRPYGKTPRTPPDHTKGF
jgi:hypothetical protein